MATVYHRDDAGAPVLTYSGSGQADLNAVKAVLKACLVYGYGSKPAAGWELISEGTDFIVLRNGSRSGYVCLKLSNQGMRVYLSETYTGVSGGIITGDGVKSGNAAGSTLPQFVYTMMFAWTSIASTWTVVADEKTFILAAGGKDGGADVPLTNAAIRHGSFTLYVGEDSEGFFISAGGAASTYDSGAIYSVLSGAAGFTALKDPSSGLLVGAQALPITTPSLALTVGTITNTVAQAQVTLVPVRWIAGSPAVVAGRLRGIALCPEVYPVTYAAQAAMCLGHPTVLTLRTANTPIDLGDGHSYFVRLGDWTSPFWLFTDNPEFW